MSGGHILLVEDDDIERELTLSALAEARLTNPVVIAQDGAEALDYLLRRGCHAARGDGDPILVLLDLRLPKVDGLEVLAAIRANPELRGLAVVIQTSSNDERDLAVCRQLAVETYISKPVDFDKLLAAVRQLRLGWVLLKEAHD
jgi:CheY-like chemotaxis protein